jgi:nitrile hydratase accessory protein
MTQLTSAAQSEPLGALPRLPRDETGPVFAAPWQAHAFALAVKLSEQGHFTWKEWAAALAKELEAAARRGEPDDGSHYYEHWVAALEKLVTAKGLADPGMLRARKEDWAAAYRSTPHGQPVELSYFSPDVRGLLLGIACTVATFWVLQQTSMDPLASASSATLSQAPSLLPSLGLAASAGFGALLGMRHALEPDHLVAISTLMTGERSSAKAAWLGACWGLGHTVTLLTTGALLVVLEAQMPAIAAQLFELSVVMLLIGFGARAIYQGAGGRRPRATHSHRRVGAASLIQVDRATLARPLLVGAVHGLAGSGALTALVVTTLPSTVTRLAYLMLFGVGSTAAMAALSGLLGWPIARLGVQHTFVRAAIRSSRAGCNRSVVPKNPPTGRHLQKPNADVRCFRL